MKHIIIILAFLLLSTIANSQVKIGDNPTSLGSSSSLELESTNKALVITRVTNTAAITNPVNGMIIYDISSKCIKSYENGAWTNCLSNGSSIQPSTNGTAVVSNYICSTGSVGTLYVGITPNGVTQTLTANVTQSGTYSIIAISNGVVFSGSGTFTRTGSQTVVLTALGTPTIAGTATFTINTTPVCSFTRNIIDQSSNGSATISSYNCNTASAGTLNVGVAASGVTQTITAMVTTAGTYSISTTTANGITFSGSGSVATGSQTILLTAAGTPTTPTSNTYTLNTTPNCGFNRSAVQASTNGTAIVSAYNCSTATTGVMTMGTSVTGVSQTITATVTTVGTYNISTTANGVTFSAIGTFTGTGSQPIVLAATGTPAVSGTFSYTLNTSPTCSFTRSVGDVFSTAVCASTLPSYPATVTVGTTNVTVTKTGGGILYASFLQCGLTPAGSSIALASGESATYSFTMPLKNLQFYGSDNQNYEYTGGYTVSASLAGVSVPIQLVPFGGSCSGNFVLSQSGNTASAFNLQTAPTATAIFNISSTSAYDTVTFTRGIATGTNDHGLMLCNATVLPNPTSGGTAVVSAYTCSTASAGTMNVGIAVSGVSQTITATVTRVGTYNISAVANGVTFSASGTFSGTGNQNIILTATGTPTSAATSSYILSTTPNCNFTRITCPVPVAPTSSVSPSTFVTNVNADIGGNVATFTASGGTYNTLSWTLTSLPATGVLTGTTSGTGTTATVSVVAGARGRVVITWTATNSCGLNATGSSTLVIGDAVLYAMQNAGCASCTAYDGASANGWVNVTAAEYDAVMGSVNLGTINNGGLIDSQISNTPSGNGGSPSFTTYNSGTNYSTFPANNYVIAFRVKTSPTAVSGTVTGVKLKYAPGSTDTNTGWTDEGTAISIPTANQRRVFLYFVKKRPSAVLSTSPTQIGIYMGSSAVWLGSGGISGASERWGFGDITGSFPNTGTSGYYYQIKGTATKAW